MSTGRAIAIPSVRAFEVLAERRQCDKRPPVVVLTYARPIAVASGSRFTYRCLGHLTTDDETMEWFGRRIADLPDAMTVRLRVEIEEEVGGR